MCLISCADISIPFKKETLEDIARHHGWTKENIKTEKFNMVSFYAATLNQHANLTIYIEGDGRAWLQNAIPPKDPTPMHSLLFDLAMSDSRLNVIYLARPCQYNPQDTNCAEKYWTSHRFSPEVIQSTNQAIDFIKMKSHAEKINLIGYSGGAAVALLAAAYRSDVLSIITIGGNLDHKTWTDKYHLAPLNGSLNPIDFTDALSPIPQYHFVGAEDDITGVELIKSYSDKIQNPSTVKYYVIPKFNHVCCWDKIWPQILNHEMKD
jgi:hypothetical protein